MMLRRQRCWALALIYLSTNALGFIARTRWSCSRCRCSSWRNYPTAIVVSKDPSFLLSRKPGLAAKVEQRNETEILWSYVYSLQKVRRDRLPKAALLQPARSLVHFLETSLSLSLNAHTISVLEPLERAVVQAIRAAASTNDYRLIRQLFLASQQHDHRTTGALLDASFALASNRCHDRIASESVAGLGRTNVNDNKIRAVYQAASVVNGVWQKSRVVSGYADNNALNQASSFTAVVNAILQVWVKRGKVRAALQVYRNHTAAFNHGVDLGSTDAYSFSLVLQALEQSVTNDQKAIENHLVTNGQNVGSALFQPSPSWQWNEAVVMLDAAWNATAARSHSHQDSAVLNNHVVSAFLQLNQRVTHVFGARHNGAQHALELYHLLAPAEQLSTTSSPVSASLTLDQVTCTLFLSSLGTEWERALEFLRECYDVHRIETGRTQVSWLPEPNEYMYSAAMTVCATNGQYTATLTLLNDCMERKTLRPNSYMYNSVLQSLLVEVGGRKQGKRRNQQGNQQNRSTALRMRCLTRLIDALAILERMRDDKVQSDTVTYNTMLSIVATSGPHLSQTEWRTLSDQFPSFFELNAGTRKYQEKLVNGLLLKMTTESVARDTLTYKHAMQALGERSSILQLMYEYLEVNRRCAPEVFKAALFVLANMGDYLGVFQLLGTMPEIARTSSADAALAILTALGKGNMTGSLATVLQVNTAVSATSDDHEDAIFDIAWDHGVDLQTATMALEASHFSSAIMWCLKNEDFDSARTVLACMREAGIRPSPESLEGIARTYATMSLQHSSNTTKSMSSSDKQRIASEASRSRAKSAYFILSSISNPSASVVASVTRACGSAGMFHEAQSLLRTLHKRVLRALSEQQLLDRQLAVRDSYEDERVLPALHRSLLKYCAQQGNVTYALRFCEDIQYISKELSTVDDERWQKSVSSLTHGAGKVGSFKKTNATADPNNSMGMEVEEWKYLLVAASKAGHWRVCLSTLQYLRPYVEETHKQMGTDESEYTRLHLEYSRLEHSVTSVAQCLALRSQYAWLVRTLHDWIDWSGRRPPKNAVLAAIRVLSSRGRGEEVNTLLARCTATSSSKTSGDGIDYNTMIFVGAITALYKEGLYDEADDAFLAAVKQKALPFNIERIPYGSEKRITLDLHGLNLAVAHSAVRIALQQQATSTSWNLKELWDNDIVIVTGRGLNSEFRMRPVLRPEVQRMLVEEFYPPLSTISVPGNMGALRINSDEIAGWLDHQRQQRGARMLMIAAMLKNASSPGSRFGAAIAHVAELKSVNDAFNQSKLS